MEKVNGVVPNSQAVYLYKGHQYMEKPGGTVVKKYLYDREGNVTYLKVRKPAINKLIVVMAILIVFMIYVDLTVAKNEYKVTYQKNIYAYEGFVGINVTADALNEAVMEVGLEYRGAPVIEPMQLYPGMSIGNVMMSEEFEPGLYDCDVVCRVADSFLPVTKKLGVKLIVEEDKDGLSNQ